MLKSILGDLSVFLERTYVLSHDRSSKIKQILATLYIFVLLFFGFASLHFSGLQKSLEGPAFLNMIGVITSSHQIFMYVKRDQIKNLINMFQKFQVQHTVKWEKEISKEESKMIWNLIHNYCIILSSYLVSYQFLPIIIDTIIGYFIPTFPSLRVPLFAQGFIDFTNPRTPFNFFLSIPSIIWCCLEIIGHIGPQALILVSISYMRVELKIIQQKIILIKKIMITHEKGNPQIINQKLVNVIRHHQQILRGLRIMKSALGFPIALENTTISICFCLNLYGMFALQGKESIAAKFEGISGMFSLILVLFWSCRLGESLQDENNKFFQNLYDLPWYKENADNGKTILMMLRQSNKPFVINYHLRADLNLHTFMQIINASYSYFMVLKSTTA